MFVTKDAAGDYLAEWNASLSLPHGGLAVLGGDTCGHPATVSVALGLRVPRAAARRELPPVLRAWAMCSFRASRNSAARLALRSIS